MPVEDLSAQPALIHRDGRFFRPSAPVRADRGEGTGRAPRAAAPAMEEVRPVNGSLALAGDGFLYFAGDPFPPGGQGTYRVGEATGDDVVKLYPGLVLDAHPDGRRFRIGYRYLGTYRLDPATLNDNVKVENA